MALQVPQNAVGGDDILAPVQALLRGLSVLPTDADLQKAGPGSAMTGTPDSVAIIEAGGTALSKGFATAIALLGGAAVVKTALTGFWSGEQGGVRIALLAGTAFFLSAAAVAIAVIVAADVRGRAAGTVAQYNARSSVTTTFLELSAATAKAAAGQAPALPLAPAVLSGAAAVVPRPSDNVVWALAVSGASAPVLHTASGSLGVISGIRGAANGMTEVLLTHPDGAREWCPADQLELQELTF
jgi:hypothetical protein